MKDPKVVTQEIIPVTQKIKECGQGLFTGLPRFRARGQRFK